jgi:hypothetical protein
LMKAVRSRPAHLGRRRLGLDCMICAGRSKDPRGKRRQLTLSCATFGRAGKRGNSRPIVTDASLRFRLIRSARYLLTSTAAECPCPVSYFNSFRQPESVVCERFEPTSFYCVFNTIRIARRFVPIR